MALSAAVARLNQPALFGVLQHILNNRVGQQEKKHEDEGRARTDGTRGIGRHPGWDKKSSTALMIRLTVVLLPEWMRVVLWRALHERYTVQETSSDAEAGIIGKGKKPPADEPLVAHTG